MKKAKDDCIIETDGDFFEMLRKMERDVHIKNGDKEALAYLDEEERKRKAELEKDEDE